MKTKHSGVGIAAGILFSIPLLVAIVIDMLQAIQHPSIFLNTDHLSWWLDVIAGWISTILLIVALFRGRRSWLVFAAYVINGAQHFLQMASLLQASSYRVTTLLLGISLLFRTIMVIYCCIPDLQKYADWTGKIWFIAPVLSGITTIFNIIELPAQFWERFQRYPLWQTFQLSLNVISFAAVFLFCLWLTEPYRHKKTA